MEKVRQVITKHFFARTYVTDRILSGHTNSNALEHLKAIFDTAYWFVTPEHGEIRFTTTTDAFYIISLEEPHPEIAIPTSVPIPILDGDKVYLLGGSGKALDWRNDEDGFSISVPEDEVGLVEHAWAFKVEYARA